MSWKMENRNCLFAFLDKLAFNDSFGSFQLRQSIVYHIKDTTEISKVVTRDQLWFRSGDR